MSVEFYFSNKEYEILDEVQIIDWIQKVIGKENKIVGEINYSIVSDSQILEINQKHLSHDYFTDIITFDSSFVNIINGDIFISFETVQSNSKIYNVEILKEFCRVIIHGIMHLCGYKDYSDREKSIMRALEDKYIAYLDKL